MALTFSILFHRPPSEYSTEYSVTDSLVVYSRCLKPVPWVAIAQIVALYGSCICKYSSGRSVVLEHQAYSPFKRADEGGNDGWKNEVAEKLESGKISSTPKGLSSQGSNDQIEKMQWKCSRIKPHLSLNRMCCNYRVPWARMPTLGNSFAGFHENITRNIDTLSNVEAISFRAKLICPSDSGPQALGKRVHFLPHSILVNSFRKFSN